MMRGFDENEKGSVGWGRLFFSLVAAYAGISKASDVLVGLRKSRLVALGERTLRLPGRETSKVGSSPNREGKSV